MEYKLQKLSEKIILRYTNDTYTKLIKKIYVFDQIPSTNDFLIPYAKTNTCLPSICISETQTKGRGRFDRKWVSPRGNIYFSMLFPFKKNMNQLSRLSVIVAKSVVNTLNEIGIKEDLEIKFPNDVLWKKKKLAGILIDLLSTEENTTNAVIGIGINAKMPKDAKKNTTYPWTDINEITNKDINKNKIIGLLINNLLMLIKDSYETYRENL